jgi:AICAR transformylase/IMP cyclohydrolase PurH
VRGTNSRIAAKLFVQTDEYPGVLCTYYTSRSSRTRVAYITIKGMLRYGRALDDPAASAEGHVNAGTS